MCYVKNELKLKVISDYQDTGIKFIEFYCETNYFSSQLYSQTTLNANSDY